MDVSLQFPSRVVFNRERLVNTDSTIYHSSTSSYLMGTARTRSQRELASPSRLSPSLHTTAAGCERRNSHGSATQLFSADLKAHTCARRTSAGLEVMATLPHTTQGCIPFHTHQLIRGVEDGSFGFLVKQLPGVAHEELRYRILPIKYSESENAKGRRYLVRDIRGREGRASCLYKTHS